MGFFQDLKEDLSQAVNELMPDEALQEAEEIQSQEREEVKKEVSGKKEAQKEEASEIVIDPAELDALLKDDEGEGNKEEYSPDMVADVEAALKEVEEFDVDFQKDFQEESGNLEDDFEEEGSLEDDFEEENNPEDTFEERLEEKNHDLEEEFEEEFMEESGNLEDDFEEIEEIEENSIVEEKEEQILMQPIQEEVQSEKNIEEQESKGDRKMAETTKLTGVASDETSIITEGMTVNGDISSKGSLEVLGTINGNVETLGKLDVAGSINGDSKAAEIYADSANINGQIHSEGVIKIGQSSVIIGNIFATSAAIAGAVKGDIDVKGPVILDTTAIVMGNIKSKSVQINNGAVIEGLCSQCYADVNPTAFFEDLKKKK